MTAAKIIAIDLFCGAGGLTRGLLDAGIDVRLGIDVNPACQFPYEHNNKPAKFLLADVAKLDVQEIVSAWKNADVRLLAGCAPCQPFSTYTQGLDWNRNDHWGLLGAFGRIVRDCKPDIVTMENVGSLSRHSVFQRFYATLKEQDYEIAWRILDCRLYGVPQTRKRIALIASKLGVPIMPAPSHHEPDTWVTVRQKIGKLPNLKAGAADPQDPLHVCSELSELNLQRIRASKPGGSWCDWPEDLIAKCHRRKTGRTYPSVYGRMEWDAPAPTITGQCYGFGNGRFGHPEQDRAISLREAAILQTFPKRYKFVPKKQPIEMKNVGLMIGNAVPPRLGEVIGLAISEHLNA